MHPAIKDGCGPHAEQSHAAVCVDPHVFKSHLPKWRRIKQRSKDDETKLLGTDIEVSPKQPSQPKILNRDTSARPPGRTRSTRQHEVARSTERRPNVQRNCSSAQRHQGVRHPRLSTTPLIVTEAKNLSQSMFPNSSEELMPVNHFYELSQSSTENVLRGEVSKIGVTGQSKYMIAIPKPELIAVSALLLFVTVLFFAISMHSYTVPQGSRARKTSFFKGGRHSPTTNYSIIRLTVDPIPQTPLQDLPSVSQGLKSPTADQARRNVAEQQVHERQH
ncbi:uncharacterized protein LOC135401265 [Ornithodoros turicata]|uniref:uncharacterized protein LOC135401265 n=1 Tax=Ornithodoros turicata TaxID=34597 RepID=UPI003138A57A